MVKLVYDYQAFSWTKYGGISRYLYEIATRIFNYDDFQVKIFAGLYVNKYLENCNSDLVKGWQVPFIPKSAKIIGMIDAEINQLWLKQHNPDIVHETYYSRKDIVPKNCKTVITVHDMIHEKFNHLMPKRNRGFSQIKAAAIKRADRIICVSENTRNDLLNILDINPDKVSTIYQGYDLQNSLTVAQSPLFTYPYILYVGERTAYKNFQRLIQGYASSKVIRDNFYLVCCGSRPFASSEIAMIKKLELDKSKIIYVSGNDATLANIYTHASAFVYPSLYEGFGIPPLEAMSFDCPVVCSNSSSIPEVVADAGEYFDPYEIDSITAALERVLFSETRAKELILKGKERIKFFSWEDCAKKTSIIYRSLV
jgi:glycosyltransferase involved in cell wall biosynthesis